MLADFLFSCRKPALEFEARRSRYPRAGVWGGHDWLGGALILSTRSPGCCRLIAFRPFVSSPIDRPKLCLQSCDFSQFGRLDSLNREGAPLFLNLSQLPNLHHLRNLPYSQKLSTLQGGMRATCDQSLFGDRYVPRMLHPHTRLRELTTMLTNPRALLSSRSHISGLSFVEPAGSLLPLTGSPKREPGSFEGIHPTLPASSISVEAMQFRTSELASMATESSVTL